MDCSDRTVRDWCKTGKIKGRIVAGKWLIPEEEVDRILGQQGPTKVPPPGELVDLFQRWREQALFPSLDQLLRYFGREALQVDLLRQETDSQQALEIYDAAKRHHLRGIPEAGGVFPSVIEEGLFQRLRQDCRDDPVWEAQESWGLAYGAYVEAFSWFFAQVQHEFELLLVGAAANRPTGKNEVRERGLEAEVDRILDLLDERKRKDEQLVIFLKLAAVIVSCDLLTLGGPEQLPGNELWTLEVADKLQTVRAEATNYITEFAEPSPVPLDHIVTAAKLLWEHQPKIRQKTGDLLSKLKSLQAADDDLQSKLMAFEWRLYGVAGS